ncbi:MAG: ferritin family protein [Candidatus Altiarchaeota archaeon]
MNEVEEILQKAIELEVQQQKAYLASAAKTEREKGRLMFELLARGERAHEQFLKNQLASVREGKGWIDEDELEIHPKTENLVQKVADSKVQVKAEDITEPESLTTESTQDLDALKIAIESEIRSIEFYAQAAAKTKDEGGRKVLLRLVEEEEDHLKNLETQRFYLENHGVWVDPNSGTL